MTHSSDLEKRLLVLIFWLLIGSVTSRTTIRHSIHEFMSPNDLKSIFQVTNHHEVPEYDVTHLRIINKRSVNQDDLKQINLQAFGQNMKLSLRPNVEFNRQLESLKIFTAESRENNIIYHEETTKGQFGISYHDDNKMAAVVIRPGPNGNILMDGTIGNDLVIKPVPSTVKLANKKQGNLASQGDDTNMSSSLVQLTSSSSVNTTENEIFYNEQAHIVFKKTIYSNVTLNSDFAALEPGKSTTVENSTWKLYETNSTNQTDHLTRWRRSSPLRAVWPEVLLIVDHDSYLLHGANNEEVKQYFVTFWNGVDLRYKLLSHPRIRVSLIGMIVAKVSN